MNKRLQMLENLIAQGSQDPFVRYARALELRSQGAFEQALAALEEVTVEQVRDIARRYFAGEPTRAWILPRGAGAGRTGSVPGSAAARAGGRRKVSRRAAARGRPTAPWPAGASGR